MVRSQVKKLQQRLAQQLNYAHSCSCSHTDVDKYRFSYRIEVFGVRNTLRPEDSATIVQKDNCAR